MPNPNTKFTDSYGTDLGNKLITKEYLMSVYPQISNQLITPELWTWGANSYGQLGNNTITPRSTPVTTSAGGANWKQVASGSDHIAAIKTDGTLWTWGKNSYAPLGDNTTINRSTPVTTFAGGTNWKQVACGRGVRAAIKTDGTLWTWGGTGDGQLGNNTTNGFYRSTPVTTFAGGTNWKQVACGERHTAAIKTDGTLWAWGFNSFGSLGNNATVQSNLTPVTTFAGGTNWKQVSCGSDITAAIKTDGTLWCWGQNGQAQLGRNNSTTSICTPVTTFAGGTNWKQVDCAPVGIVAIKTDGTLWGWGRNTSGQLGDNTLGNNRSTPVTTFAGGTNWKQVASSGYHTTAIKTDGTLWNWGSNYFTAAVSATITGTINAFDSVFTTSNTTGAQIGNSFVASSPADPTGFQYLGTITSISTNTSITFNGFYYSGSNFSGTITLGSFLRLTPVTTSAGGTNWKQVASGDYHTVAIKTSDDLQGI
jgi:alpha-tubulin suppressor-like RCC1 family protein